MLKDKDFGQKPSLTNSLGCGHYRSRIKILDRALSYNMPLLKTKKQNTQQQQQQQQNPQKAKKQTKTTTKALLTQPSICAKYRSVAKMPKDKVNNYSQRQTLTLTHSNEYRPERHRERERERERERVCVCALVIVCRQPCASVCSCKHATACACNHVGGYSRFQQHVPCVLGLPIDLSHACTLLAQ